MRGTTIGIAMAMVFIGAGLAEAQAIGKKGLKEDMGPYNTPAMKKIDDSCELTPAEHEACVLVYNEYKKKEHDEDQEAKKENTKAPKGGRGEYIDAMKAAMSEEHRKKFEELVAPPKKKK